jgi:hypothetical protein
LHQLETDSANPFGRNPQIQVSSAAMAKHSSSILELARRGAQHRYEELQEELASLVQQFPDLRSDARRIVKRGRRALQAAAAELQPRKRRKMSAAARAKISAAQRARWAKQKAANGSQGKVVRKAGKKR